MTNFLYYTHSGLRWLVVLVTIIALLWLIVGMIRQQPYTRTTHRIMVAFGSLIGLQWVLGIVLFLFVYLFAGTAQGYHWLHLIVMTLALAAAHLYIPLKRRDDATRYRGGIALIVVTLALVFVGVLLLPQGWSMQVNPPVTG